MSIENKFIGLLSYYPINCGQYQEWAYFPASVFEATRMVDNISILIILINDVI